MILSQITYYNNPFFYLFIVLLIFNAIAVYIYNMRMRQKSIEMKATPIVLKISKAQKLKKW